jgi:glycosyltransferase involved in cell wall biosynthesis
VGFIEQLSRKQLNSVYNQVDCLICSSRDDPMPAFITEGMMFSKICICSEFTGTASLIDDGVNGFTYLRNDPVELAEKIRYVAENHDNLSSVRDRSRLLFEKVFRMDVFQDNLIKIVKKLSK